MDQQDRDIAEFFIDNTQNRNDDQLLLNIPDANNEIAEFFIDNTQNRNDDLLLLNIPDVNNQLNVINDFLADEEGDADVNQAYENYLSSLAANTVRNINNDHSYSNNRVSQ